MSELELNLLQLSSCGMTELRARAPQMVRSETSEARLCGIQLDYVPDDALRYTITPAFACSADATEYSPRMKFSRMDPLIQVALTHSGTGTVRMCPPLPTRSTMAQCSSRCWRCLNARSASSRHRSPQPSKIARMARSRLPFKVSGSDLCQKRRASSEVSQLPSLNPTSWGPLLAGCWLRTLG